MKTSFILAMTNFPFLAILVLIIGATVFCCIWFFSLLPAFFVIGFTGATAFHGFIMKRACARLEKKYEELNDKGESGIESDSESDAESDMNETGTEQED